MNQYFENLNEEVKEYFKILSPEFPEWMIVYINVPEIMRLSGISTICGTDYFEKMFHYKSFNSTLNHSIGVALIIWNFTHDKKQTLSGLFHDIATPAFKHTIDFMNGDSEHQESTEERTEQIIRESKDIMKLLNRDKIKVEEISDYKIYPIADNNTPKLSADRFEYTFSNGLFVYDMWSLDEVRKFYNNVTILENEDGIQELGFKDSKICEEYVHKNLPIFAQYITDSVRTTIQFLADIIKSMNIKGYITIYDLYVLSDREVIDKILKCDDNYIRESFIKFQNITTVWGSNKHVQGKYCISVRGKTRYINPLTQYENGVARINQVSNRTKKEIDEYLKRKQSTYTGFDFDFKPYV